MNILKRFTKNKKGNIAPLTAILIIPLMLAGGLALDSAIYYNTQSKIQNLADLAALAGVQEQNETDMANVANDFFEANKIDPGVAEVVNGVDVEATIRDGVKNVQVKVSAEQSTILMRLAGIGDNQFEIAASSSVEEKKSEISVVLDVSYSMRGVKIVRLREAMEDFIDILLEEQAASDLLSMNIVPFGGNVNIGPQLTQRFTPADDDANFDPTDAQYKAKFTSGDVLAEADFRFTDGMNCVELKREDYDASLIPTESRSQLPRFINRRSGATICPEDDSSSLWNSSDRNALKNKIRNMVLSHGTTMDVGAVWGYKALSPEYRDVFGGDFDDRPSDFGGNTQKVMVIMTDGNITGQGRPKTVTDIGRPGNQTVVEAGNLNSAAGSDTSIGRFRQICNEANANGVNIFTIGFRIRRGTVADTLLQECASAPQNYYLVESLDISSAFEAIAASIKEIVLTN